MFDRYNAAVQRFEAAQTRMKELIRLYSKPMPVDELMALPDVQEALEEISEAEQGLSWAKYCYIHGPVHYVVALCDRCGTLH